MLHSIPSVAAVGAKRHAAPRTFSAVQLIHVMARWNLAQGISVSQEAAKDVEKRTLRVELFC
jgi:hypothetical protein